MAHKNKCLQDFKSVKDNLKASRKSQVAVLHKFIFENEGDRRNRQRLREFTGFDFDANDEDFKRKEEYIKKNLTNADLMSICLLLGLDYNKSDLKTYIFKNLRNGYLLQDADEDDEEDDDDEENDANDEDGMTVIGRNDGESTDDAASYLTRRTDKIDDDQQSIYSNQSKKETNTMQQPRFALNFRDIEDSIKTFDGEGGSSIEDWVQEFEDSAAMLYWDQLQMLIFARRSLTGLARQFVAGEKGLKTWPKLKNALMNEFKPRVNSRKVHKILTDRTMKKGESVMEYLYKMKEIAGEGNVTEKDLILYIIDGIKDVNINKQILYGACNLREFKEKIHDYEEYIAKQPNKVERNNSETKTTEHESRGSETKVKKKYANTTIKCFNCGENGHKSSNCKNRSKGTKCFQCNDFGHLAKDCKSRKDDKQQKEVQCVMTEEVDMVKKVVISDHTWEALIDTGSHVNLMKEKIFHRLNLGNIEKTNILLAGFGPRSKKIKPIGCKTVEVKIDNENYELVFCIVPDDYMSNEIIIGKPICKQAEVVANPEGVRVVKWVTARMMNIEVHTENDTNYDIEETVSRKSKDIVHQLINSYTPDKKKDTNVTMKIVLTEETPISSRPRRLPFNERQLVEKQIEEWLREGVIECSESEFSSPIVLVAKKDGSKRLCVDYRRINKNIVRDRFPLPLIEDQLDRLQDATVFSTIDLKNGFFHVAVDKDSRKYTAFVTHNGQYQFCKVPFGLANSPAVFQRFINAIFRSLTQKGIAMPYVDDIIVPAKNEEEAVANLKEVLYLARDYGLNLNVKKCHFIKRRIEFLGHLIENQRISPSPTKMKAVINYPVPKTLKQVESFLGLAGYFRKFIPEFAKLAKALNDLKKKETIFFMGKAQLESFEALKTKLCGNPVLKIFNQCHETELHTDASADGYGAVLLQRLPDDGYLHPVYFFSKKTTDLERKYTSYELEILAVVEALKKFRVYLLGLKFKLVTDCNAFATTMEKKDLTTRVARWLLLLQEYEYVIEHRSGTKMRHVDALSRQPVMMVTRENTMSKIKRAQSSDESLKPIIQILQKDEIYNDYYLKCGVLYKDCNGREKIVIPRDMQYEIIGNSHNQGHFGLKKTKELIDNDYHIDKLDEKINQFISNCITCILVNRKKGKQEGELNPIRKSDTPLQTYHIDFVGPLETTSKSYKRLLVIVDAFSKFCIITDRGAAFTGDEFKQYCDEDIIKHLTVTTGLPRANGQVERMNAVVASVLAKCSIDNPGKWYQHVERVQRCINSSFSRSTHFTPFELLVGVKMKTKQDLAIKTIVEEESKEEFNNDRDKMRKEAKMQIIKMQEENRRTFNQRRKPARQYLEGEKVAIKRTQMGGGLKLKPKFLGPYLITRRKGNNTYDVQKIGSGEGPNKTTTCAEYVKPWPNLTNTFETNV